MLCAYGITGKRTPFLKEYNLLYFKLTQISVKRIKAFQGLAARAWVANL